VGRCTCASVHSTLVSVRVATSHLSVNERGHKPPLVRGLVETREPPLCWEELGRETHLFHLQ
jgi:hypothetical protein